MKVLVTGADGFIGSHLAEGLVRSGFSVRAMAMYNALGTRGWLDDLTTDVQESIDFVFTDIRDPSAIRKVVSGCDAIINMAALIGIPYSYEAPASYIETNVLGTLNVLVAARDLGVSQVVQTSTSEVYGTAQFVPITEDHPLRAQSPYAASKIAADQMALAFHRSYQLPVKVVRPFNTYGPRQSTRAVIPTIIAQLLSGSQEVHLGATRPTRDLTYVSDTAAGFVAVLNSDRAVGQVINLGSEFEVSVRELVEIIGSEMGVSPSIVSDAGRLRPKASEVDRLFADTTLARSILDWSPAFAGMAGLRKGIGLTIDWFASRERPLLRPSYYQK